MANSKTFLLVEDELANIGTNASSGDEMVIHKRKILTELSEVELSSTDTLFTEGDDSHNLYLLKKGGLRVFKAFEDGTEKELGVIGPNELVGEMSFIDKGPRSATVVATTDCNLVQLPLDDFEKYLSTQPIWLKTLISTLLNRLRDSNEKPYL